MTFSVFVFGSILRISLCQVVCISGVRAGQGFLFLHLCCPFYLFCFGYLVLVAMYQRWKNNSGLSFLCLLWFWFCLFGFGSGVRSRCQRRKILFFAFVSVVSILFCFCPSGFGCGVRGVRGGQILLSIKSSSLPSCPSPRSEYLH